MRKWRAIGLLFTGTLAAAIFSTGLATAAQAEATPPVPQPGVDYEIFGSHLGSGGTSKCLDVPGGSTQSGQPLVVYHCHGFDGHGANQLWDFDAVPGVPNEYVIQNRNSHLCLEVPTTTGEDGVLLEQGSCDSGNNQWLISSPFFTAHWNLSSVQFPGKCMAASNSSDPANTATWVRLEPCDSGLSASQENLVQTWQLG